MSLDRSKRLAALVLRVLQRPAVLVALSHDERAALSDLIGELIELNQRLDRLEKNSHTPFDFSDLVRRLESLELARTLERIT